MADIRPVTPDFAVAPQLLPGELAEAKARGFVFVINNRPDGEAPGQPTAAEMKAAAEAQGLGYAHIPVVGRPTEAQVKAVAEAAAGAGGPALAFCRSGTRSIVSWSLGQISLGEAGRPREEIVRLGEAAGYDLSSVI